MLSYNFDYFNYDYAEHRLSLLDKSWDRAKELAIRDRAPIVLLTRHSVQPQLDRCREYHVL